MCHYSQTLFLFGVVESYPKFDSAVISSSPLITLSEDLTWARTVSRFYELGSYLKANREVERLESPISKHYGWPTLEIGDARDLLSIMASRFRRTIN
ncbi:DUF6634 family protein [Pseudorhodobacter sp. MZDSW-24AT]|uniref:DUF6634 family protein n=1 Tax=Pseudorhodobacter sp. MZDSW-24AT TaxID=2052957 RepID=UPI003510340F